MFKSYMIEQSVQKKDDDEISLIDLFSVLWRRKRMIIITTVSAMIGVVAFSIVSLKLPQETSPLPNKYTPQALLLINDNSSSSKGGGLSSLLGNSSGLGGLASMAGMLSGGGTNAALAIFLTTSDLFLDTIVDEFDLITRYKIEKYPRASSRKALSKLLKAESDEKSGVITVGFTDKEPEFATEVVNFAIYLLEQRFDEMGIDKNKLEKENLEINMANSLEEIKDLQIRGQTFARSLAGASGAASLASMEAARIQIELEAQKQVYSQLKVQYELLKVTMASEKPVFQVLETARVPDMKSKPSRGLICIIVTFAAGFFAVFLAFALNAVENIKKDPEAMAKLRASSGRA